MDILLPRQINYLGFLCSIILSVFLFSFPHGVLAGSFRLISFPDEIKEGEVYETEASISGLYKETPYFLRVAFSLPEKRSYFGSTWNGLEWYDGKPSPIDHTKFFPITTDQNKAWVGKIRTRVFLPQGYASGEYMVKVGRYTKKGSGPTWTENTRSVFIEKEQPQENASQVEKQTIIEETSCGGGKKISLLPERISLSVEEELIVSLCWSGLKKNSTYFLKGSFFTDGSTVYKGMTKNNGGEWKKQKESYAEQKKVFSDGEGVLRDDIVVKVSAKEASVFDEPFIFFKVGRYTKEGSGPTWSDSIQMEFVNTQNVSNNVQPQEEKSQKEVLGAIHEAKQATVQGMYATPSSPLTQHSSPSLVDDGKSQKKQGEKGYGFLMFGGLFLAGSLFFLSKKKQGKKKD